MSSWHDLLEARAGPRSGSEVVGRPGSVRPGINTIIQHKSGLFVKKYAFLSDVENKFENRLGKKPGQIDA